MARREAFVEQWRAEQKEREAKKLGVSSSQYRLMMDTLADGRDAKAKAKAKAKAAIIIQAAVRGWLVHRNMPGYTVSLMYIVSLLEHNDPESIFILANHYYNGYGIVKDVEEAVRLYRLAADQGHKEAQLFLWSFYSEVQLSLIHI